VAFRLSSSISIVEKERREKLSLSTKEKKISNRSAKKSASVALFFLFPFINLT
jgi:hypothetical protein